MTSSTHAVRRVDITISTPKNSWLYIAKVDIRKRLNLGVVQIQTSTFFKSKKLVKKTIISSRVRLKNKIRTRMLVQRRSEHLKVKINYVSTSPTSPCGDFSYVMK